MSWRRPSRITTSTRTTAICTAAAASAGSFCFSMLNLVLADNLFQVFLSWELVGICSYLLIGFYYERTSAANAANKAFITNRIGDAGFIIGLLILWTSL